MSADMIREYYYALNGDDSSGYASTLVLHLLITCLFLLQRGDIFRTIFFMSVYKSTMASFNKPVETSASRRCDVAAAAGNLITNTECGSNKDYFITPSLRRSVLGRR